MVLNKNLNYLFCVLWQYYIYILLAGEESNNMFAPLLLVNQSRAVIIRKNL